MFTAARVYTCYECGVTGLTRLELIAHQLRHMNEDLKNEIFEGDTN